MNDTGTIAAFIALVFGLTAALRKAAPKIDGIPVLFVAMLLGFVVAFLNAGDVHAYRTIAWLGFQIGAGAIAAASGGSYLATKLGGSIGAALGGPVVSEILEAGGAVDVKPAPSPAVKAATLTGSMLGALMLCLALGAGLLVLASCSGCGAPLTGPQVTPAVDAGCVMVGVIVKDQLVGNACEDAAPLIGTLIADAVNALPVKAGDELPTHLLPVTRGGKTIGYVRSDLAPAVQAKLDAS